MKERLKFVCLDRRLKQKVNALVKKQVWFCEACRQVGCVEAQAFADAWSVVGKLARSHMDLSPECPVLAGGLRVIHPAVITSRAALLADSSIPEWVVDPVSHFFGFEDQEASLVAPNRLDRELHSILQPLGVEPENISLRSGEYCHGPTRPLIISFYDWKDSKLWGSLQAHLDLLIQHTPSLAWRTYKIANNAWAHEHHDEIATDMCRASLVLLGLSVDFLTTLHGEGRYILAALQRACEQDPLWDRRIQPILLSPVSLDFLHLVHRRAAPSRYNTLLESSPRAAGCVDVISSVKEAMQELLLQPPDGGGL